MPCLHSYWEKNFCKRSALFPEHCTGIQWVLAHPDEPCGALPSPKLPTDSEEKPGWINCRVFSFPKEFQAGQDHVVPLLRVPLFHSSSLLRSEFRKKTGMGGEGCNPRLPAPRFVSLLSFKYAASHCSARYSSETLAYAFFSPRPLPSFPWGWNRLFEGWDLQKWIVITWRYVILWAETTFRLFFQLPELSYCASLLTFSIFPQDINAVFLAKRFACRSGCNQIWEKKEPMCTGWNKR